MNRLKISMGKAFCLTLTLLLMGLGNKAVAADTDISAMSNVVYIENFEAGIGKQVVISVKMKNADPVVGFQFELTLPEGMSFAKNDMGVYMVKISGNRTTTEYHGVTPALQSNGALKVLCSSQQLIRFSGNDGEVLQITVDVDEDMAAGSYPVVLSNVIMGATSDPSQGTSIDRIESTVTVFKQEYDVLLDENSTTMPEACTNKTVRVNRTIKANTWSTICLPFAMDATQVEAAFGSDVQLGDFSSWSSEEDDDGNIVSIAVNFLKITEIEANHPCIIKTSSNIEYFDVENVSVDAEEEPSVQVGKKKADRGYLTGTYIANTVIPENNLFFNNGNFYYSKGKTKTKAFRAYFELADVLTEVKETAASRVFMSFRDKDGELTTIDVLPVQPKVTGRVYSLSGQSLCDADDMDSLPKGIYIVNGKKVIK